MRVLSQRPSQTASQRPHGLAAVFEPRRVALVGASDQPGRIGELVWRNLSDFPGEVVPVTPSSPTVGGRKAVPSLGDIEEPVDLVVIAVPAPAVPGVVAQAAARSIPAAIVLSSGFAETGEAGARLQDELMTAARQGGVRIVGPNCFGVQNCDLPLNASLAAGAPTGGGGITLVTQSGAYGMAIHSTALDERTRFAKVYAAGNKADISDAELLRYLAQDPATGTICYFLESLPDGREFYEEARRTTRHKPVIVTRTGRSVAGAQAARSHTAALAGHERVWRAAFEQAGVLVARSGLEMIDAARALDGQPPPAGSRVAIITNSGGTGVELADLLADEGLDVPELSGAVQDELRSLLPPYASVRNPIDLTPVWSRFAELYPALVERLARSGEVDVVVPVLLQRAAIDEAVAVGLRAAVARLRTDGVGVAVHACWVAPRAARPNADLLQEAGIPCFEWPERTARAVGHAVRYGRLRSMARAAAPRRSPPAPWPLLPDGLLDPLAAADLLRSAGVPVVPSVGCADLDEALRAAEGLGYPVVAKVLHPSIVHKSEAGGVRTGLSGPDGLAGAAADLIALAPGARLLVQPEARGIEVAVGAIRDHEFGPAVMVGLGGILVEVLGDVVFGLPPFDLEDAHRMLRRLRGFAVLGGTRGRPGVDLDALATVVRGVGDLVASHPEIAEVDVNPVTATSEGCLAVDWRVFVARP